MHQKIKLSDWARLVNSLWLSCLLGTAQWQGVMDLNPLRWLAYVRLSQEELFHSRYQESKVRFCWDPLTAVCKWSSKDLNQRSSLVISSHDSDPDNSDGSVTLIPTSPVHVQHIGCVFWNSRPWRRETLLVQCGILIKPDSSCIPSLDLAACTKLTS